MGKKDYFMDMTHNRDFWYMCWDERFMDKKVISEKCDCDDFVKKSCMTICDMQKNKINNEIIDNFISVCKESILLDNQNKWK